MLFTEAIDMLFTVFGQRYVISVGMGEPRIELIFSEFRIVPEVPRDLICELGESKRVTVTPGKHIELDLRSVRKECDQWLRTFRGVRLDSVRNFEAPLLIAPYQAKRQSSLHGYCLDG